MHAGTIQLPANKAKRGKSYRDAAFMGIMRKTMVSRLREIVSIPVAETYGYITKYHRESIGLPKSHINDAIVISKNFEAVPDNTYFVSKAVRHHNRQIHKNAILKGGIRKRNQASHTVKGFRLFDTVEYEDKEYFVFGRRTSGFMDIRTLDGTKVNKGSVSFKKIKYLSTNKGVLTERRMAIPPADKSAGFLAR